MKRRINYRKLTSLSLLISFIFISFSGIILYMAPEGSASRWINWTVLSMDKSDWEAQHTLFTYLFLIFTIIHVFVFNRKQLFRFMINKTGILISTELIISLSILILLFIANIDDSRVLRWVYKKGNVVSEWWLPDKDIPVKDADKIKFYEFVNQYTDCSNQEAIKSLKSHDISVADTTKTLYQIAVKNDTSPREIYNILKDSL